MGKESQQDMEKATWEGKQIQDKQQSGLVTGMQRCGYHSAAWHRSGLGPRTSHIPGGGARPSAANWRVPGGTEQGREGVRPGWATGEYEDASVGT